MSADKNNYQKLKSIFPNNSEIIQAHTLYENNSAKDLFNNIKGNEKNILQNFNYLSFSKRSQMCSDVISKINNMLKNGIKPSEISIITPLIDDMLKFTLKENFKNINLFYLTGNEKLIQNRLVLSVITILKLNTDLVKTLSEFDIRVLLSEILNIPLKYCEDILYAFDKTKKLSEHKFKDNEYSEKYNNLLKLVEKLSVSEQKISEQIIKIYSEKNLIRKKMRLFYKLKTR